MAHSLSQDDFRKLLATPRPGGGAPPKQAPAANPAKKQSSEFAKPAPIQHRKKKEWKRPDAHVGTDPTIPMHRDRAKERREGINPDYKDSEEIMSRLNQALIDPISQDVAEKERAELIYQQSKYLGGDLEHTHLVKGLDFALLKKVRSEMMIEKSEIDKEQVAKEYLDSVSDTTESSNQIKSKLAQDIYHLTIVKPNEPLPLKNDLFRAGRMAFCWNMDSSMTPAGLDPDIPTTIIRSISDIQDDGKSTVTDSDIVIGKIAKILESVRFGTRSQGVEGMTAGEKRDLKKRERERLLQAELKKKKEQQDELQPLEPPVPEDDDEDIFADAGRDYIAESKPKNSSGPSPTTAQPASTKPAAPISYFMEPKDDDSEDNNNSADKDEMPSATNATHILQTAAMLHTLHSRDSATDKDSSTNISRQSQHQDAITRTKESLKGGMSLSHAGQNYGEEDMNQLEYYDSDEYDGEDDPDGGADGQAGSEIDRGSKMNKRLQKSRFDFDTEEEWVAYKESQVHIPKAAFQFGVKLGDGRVKSKDLGGGGKRNEAARLNREFQQLDKLMGEKYGNSLAGGESKSKSNNNKWKRGATGDSQNSSKKRK